MKQMLRKILEDFPGNTQKQRHSVTGVSLEYLEYSSETPVIERRHFMRFPQKSSKNFLKSYSRSLINEFDKETVPGDYGWNNSLMTKVRTKVQRFQTLSETFALATALVNLNKSAANNISYLMMFWDSLSGGHEGASPSHNFFGTTPIKTNAPQGATPT